MTPTELVGPAASVAPVALFGRASQFLDCRDGTLTVRGPSGMSVRLLTFLGLSHLIQPQRATAA